MRQPGSIHILVTLRWRRISTSIELNIIRTHALEQLCTAQHTHKTIRKWFVGVRVCVRRQYTSSSRVLILSPFYSLSLLHPIWWKALRMEGADARTHRAYCMCQQKNRCIYLYTVLFTHWSSGIRSSSHCVYFRANAIVTTHTHTVPHQRAKNSER